MAENITFEDVNERRAQMFRNAAKKFYGKKIRENEEFYAAEKERIKAYKKNRYNTDPEYREKVMQRNREYYLKKKAATQNTAN
jgi:hypothetical protein